MQVEEEAFDSIPAIELSNFAVNVEYRKNIRKHVQSDAIRSKNLYYPLFDAWLSMWE